MDYLSDFIIVKTYFASQFIDICYQAIDCYSLTLNQLYFNINIFVYIIKFS